MPMIIVAIDSQYAPKKKHSGGCVKDLWILEGFRMKRVKIAAVKQQNKTMLKMKTIRPIV